MPELTIVPWSSGTEEQIAAILDAAQKGDIDLQQDAHWSIGDARTITLGSFVDGEGTTHGQQNINIVITSFENYMHCGCLLQFDFQNVVEGIRIHSSNTNAGGYGRSELKTVTIPAIVNALPTCLKTRLVTFTCLAGEGRGGNGITIVTGNKLALRSEMEVFGTHQFSEEGEGTQLAYYNSAERRKKSIYGSGTAENWSCRSAYPAYPWYAEVRPNDSIQVIEPNDSTGNIAPFGCLGGSNNSEYKVTYGELKSVADSIREKANTSGKLKWPAEFCEAIKAISGKNSTLIARTATANKVYNPADENADGYSLFTVNVPQVISTGRCPRSEQTTGFQYGTLLSTMSWEGKAKENEA